MTSKWQGENCEYCRFRLETQCYKNPPPLKPWTGFNRYPTVGIHNEPDNSWSYQEACSQYEDARE